jgi:hypothetical protein
MERKGVHEGEIGPVDQVARGPCGAIHPKALPDSPIMGNLGDMRISTMCCQIIGVDGPTPTPNGC